MGVGFYPKTFEGNPDFKAGMHCGPVMVKKKGKWVATAAGPTTSIREEPYQAGIIERLGVRGVIGKGGMGEKTRIACEKFGCVYFHAVGGAGEGLRGGRAGRPTAATPWPRARRRRC